MATTVNQHVQIRVKGLPSQWKDITFEDRKYIKHIRFYKVEPGILVYETDETFKSIEYPNIFLNLPVASFSYERRVLEIDITENIGLESLQTGEEILVIDENVIYYQCSIDSIEYEKQSNSTLYRANVTLKVLYKYQDAGEDKQQLENENYYNDFVTSTYLLAKYSPLEIYSLTLYNYENVDTTDLTSGIVFYSKFYPKITRTENEIDKNVLANGDVLVNKIQSFQVINFRLYVTETERNQLKKYSDVCYFKDAGGVDNGAFLLLGDAGASYISVKPIEIEYVENGELNNLGIYQCNIKLFTDKLNYSPYLNR